MKALFSLLLCVPFFARAQEPVPDLKPANQILRTGLTGWTQGLLPLEIEQRLGRKFSVSLITGLTFRSPFNELYAEMWSDGATSSNFLSDNGSGRPIDYPDEYHFRSHNHRRARIGYQGGLDFYFYPKRNAGKEHFVGLGAVYRRFNSRAEMVDPDKPQAFSYVSDGFPRRTGSYQQESIKALDCLLSFGTASHWKNHLCLALRFQAGVRLQTATMQDLGFQKIGFDYYGINAVNSFDAIRPVFGFDLLFGGWR